MVHRERVGGARVSKDVDLRVARVLLCIINYQAEHGYPPTQREIQQGAGIKSASSVWRDLQRLKKAGLIFYEPGLPRTLRLVK